MRGLILPKRKLTGEKNSTPEFGYEEVEGKGQGIQAILILYLAVLRGGGGDGLLLPGGIGQRGAEFEGFDSSLLNSALQIGY